MEQWNDSNIPSFHVGGIKLVSLKAAWFQYIIEIPRRQLTQSTPSTGKSAIIWDNVIAENGETLINRLAYTDLNPLRAGLVERPEQYRWNSLGYFTDSGIIGTKEFVSANYGRFKDVFMSKRDKIP